MNHIFRSVKIIDTSSPYNGEITDIFIENGNITRITPVVPEQESQIIHCISPGWFDMRANFRDPGMEYKETLETGCLAATAGGFTSVAVMPSTLPPVHSKSQVEYIRKKTEGNIVNVFPTGTISHNLEGKELSELYDMYLAGAVAFTDDKNSVKDAGLLLRAMLYAKSFSGLIMNYAEDRNISAKGSMNESITSTLTGMKGIPNITEEVIVARDIYLAGYADVPLHIAAISSAGSVDLIRKAKAKGLKITADIAAHQIALDDSVLASFDSAFKVKPPLRTQQDIEALKAGLADGTIDVICSDHSPEDEENKKVEFDYAAYGIIGLETCFAIANTHLSTILSLEQLIHKIAIRPRQILNLEIPSVKEGNKAELTLFAPNMEWTFTEKYIRSKSKNTPFCGTTFRGKAVAVVNNGLITKIEE